MAPDQDRARDVAPKTYRVELLDAVRRFLHDQEKTVRKRVGEAINDLQANPRPPGVTALQGKDKGLLRVRVGDFRIVYQCKDSELLVLIVKVGDRKEIYKR